MLQISYWKQFEHGILTREAVRKLVELVDIAADTDNGYVDTDEIRKTWKIKGLYAYLVRWSYNTIQYFLCLLF